MCASTKMHAVAPLVLVRFDTYKDDRIPLLSVPTHVLMHTRSLAVCTFEAYKHEQALLSERTHPSQQSIVLHEHVLAHQSSLQSQYIIHHEFVLAHHFRCASQYFVHHERVLAHPSLLRVPVLVRKYCKEGSLPPASIVARASSYFFWASSCALRADVRIASICHCSCSASEGIVRASSTCLLSDSFSACTTQKHRGNHRRNASRATSSMVLAPHIFASRYSLPSYLWKSKDKARAKAQAW